MKIKMISLAVALILTAASAFATHGTRMVGFNAKTVGRGGTGFSVFDNSALMMTNPAGIAFLNHRSLDGNFSLMIPDLHFTNSINDREGETNYFPIVALGYVDPMKETPWSWGIGVFTQGGMGADFTLNHDLFRDPSGSFIPQKYHSKLAVMQGGPTIAYRISPELSVGFSAHLMYSMLEFEMPYSLEPTLMKGIINPETGMTFGDLFAASPTLGGFGYSEVTASAAMNDLTAFNYGLKIGLAYKVNDAISLGISYTSPTSFTYKSGTALMDMTSQMNDAFGKAVQGYMAQNPDSTPAQAQAAVMQQFGQMGIDLTLGTKAEYDLEANLKFPQSLGFGASINAATGLRFAFDVEWVNWKDAFDKMTLSLSNGQNPNINRMLGNAGTLNVEFPMEWENEIAFRFGTEYDYSEYLTLRAGYAYGGNPVPSETIFPVFPAIVDNHIMVGGSYNVFEPLTIHAAYELALNKKQNAVAQSLVANEYNNSTSELTENIFHISLTWGL